MAAEDQGGSRRLTAEELARAARVEVAEVEAITAHGMLEPGRDGHYRPSDIQRVRAIMAMRSPGLTLADLRPIFEAKFFTLQPMDLLYPEPAAVTDTTFSQLAAEVGLEYGEFLRLVIAAGFPGPSPDEPIREDDADLARMLVDAGRKLGGGEILMRTARVFGESTRRAAEASIALFDEGVNRRLARELGDPLAIDPQLRDEINQLGANLMRLSEALLAGLYRRHLEHAMLSLWAAGAEQALDLLGARPMPEAPPAMAFIDLSGFSTLTEAAGDAVAATMAAQLAELAEMSSARHRGRVVKLLGDGAMLHFREVGDAVRGALDLVTAIADSELPPARGGVHAGPVIERDGDYFGRTVNLAARITSTAEPGQVLVSEIVADRPTDGLLFRPLGERALKGIGNVALFEARPASAD